MKQGTWRVAQAQGLEQDVDEGTWGSGSAGNTQTGGSGLLAPDPGKRQRGQRSLGAVALSEAMARAPVDREKENRERGERGNTGRKTGRRRRRRRSSGWLLGMSEAGEAAAGGLHGRHGWALQSPTRTADARRRSRGTAGTVWEWRQRSRGTAGTRKPVVTSMAPVCSSNSC